MRILVTGGAGFIGSALANSLSLDPKNQVVSADNLSTGDLNRQSSLIRNIDIDLAHASQNDLAKLCQGSEILYHLAAVKLHNAENSYENLIASNIHATKKILDSAGMAGVKKVIFTSSLYVYGLPRVPLMKESLTTEPLTLYGATKLFGETLTRIASQKYGFSYSIARLFFIYGPHQYAKGGYKSVIFSNFEKLKSLKSATINGDGNQVLDYLYISDCVSALVELSRNISNNIYNVSSGIGISINDLTDKMLAISGTEKKVYREGDWTAGTYRVGSNFKLRRDTGWESKVSLSSGLERTWESLK